MKPINFFKQVFQEFGNHKAGQMSAAFAYIAVFAIGPLLLVVVSIAGFIFGERAVHGQLAASLNNAVGPNAAKAVEGAVAHAHQGGGGIVALIIGVIGLLLAATGMTSQLQNSFDTIFSVVSDPKGGIKRTIYIKVKNLLLLIGGGLLVAASLVLSAVISGLGHSVHEHIGLPAVGAEFINEAVSFCVFVLILFFIYKVLPDVIIPKKILLGASVTIGLLFLAGKIILGIIIGRNATASAYGAAASLVVLLLWFYYTAQILLFGAEGLKVYGNNRAIIYRPKKYTLKRHSLNVDTSSLIGRLIESFALGYKKRSRDSKKKDK